MHCWRWSFRSNDRSGFKQSARIRGKFNSKKRLIFIRSFRHVECIFCNKAWIFQSMQKFFFHQFEKNMENLLDCVHEVQI